MIKKISIKNYKSIKELDISCKKINVFIGEPNGGKSNIIESLSLLSQNIINQTVSKEIIRYNTIGDLFFDFIVTRPIEVITDQLSYKLSFNNNNESPGNAFSLAFARTDKPEEKITPLLIGHDGMVLQTINQFSTPFRFYEYKRLKNFSNRSLSHLHTPNGENLPLLLLSNESYKDWATTFFKEKGFYLTLKPTENDMSMSKLVNNEIYSYPYHSVSETLQRIVFYSLAIMSNKDAVILLDEPESNTFPFYTKFLAERIALEDSNQFFITTHNPYLLLSIIEKSPQANINVFVVQMKNYQTTVTLLNEEQISEVLDLNSDVFFNLERIVD